jgi:hypothetical protein
MNTRKKKKVEKGDFFSSYNFCTECGESLDNFSLTEDSADEKAVRENHKKCVSTKKFKGDFCSKLFITIDNESDPQLNNDPLSDITLPEDEF